MVFYGDNNSERTIFLKIKVKTNSKVQKISYNQVIDSWISINLKSKPVKNKANKELIKLLSKKLNVATTQVQIIAGLKNTNKTIKVSFYEDMSKPQILEKLAN
ncbi:MAG: DUF167 domain-containing protein [Promethearchaeota archaeon]